MLLDLDQRAAGLFVLRVVAHFISIIKERISLRVRPMFSQACQMSLLTGIKSVAVRR